ncbi:hypothetical protein Q5Y75_07840 [Ruegeria sp. 2205SS24-7]|uniref:hypothetical protein n=1 Tax=Ruegeria discodermiae TaxID=3064389 RepID=UPI00274084CF|nr:hypothetical protein [Ruegeria sp. 2205SS24-7]MDP5217124.1 hypothetical protein [Ruegeria sp. 2205SS24-7]
MSIDYEKAEARAKLYAHTIGVNSPASLVADDGAPSREVLNFCLTNGASLDWIFLGDVRGMIRDSYKLAKLERESETEADSHYHGALEDVR